MLRHDEKPGGTQPNVHTRHECALKNGAPKKNVTQIKTTEILESDR